MPNTLRRGLVASLLVIPAALSLPRGVERSEILSHARDVEKSYDYVIIGGGTAGLTVADRLTEDGKTSVLVVEYGILSDSPKISTVQGGFQGVDQQFLYDTVSVPQVNLRNKTVGVMIGKVLGGSSAVNAMMTLRGTKEDYDRWGNFFSSSSEWSWKGMLPYFKKALSLQIPNADVVKSSNITFDPSFWGNTSGVFAGWPSFQYAATKVQVDAYREIPGVEFPPDSGSGLPGVFWYPTFMDQKNATRSYARTGHYSNYNRSNYHVITGSKVTKIVLDGTTATGVTFAAAAGGTNSPATTTTVKANREVILAAGGIHSPQIMQLSGLGPKKLLSAANISTVVDLPGVGQNFQDHPMITATFSFQNFTVHPASNDLYQNATFRTWANAVWAANRTGPFSIATGNAAAWLPFPVISSRWAEVAANLAAQDHAAYLPPNTDPTVAAGYKAQMLAYAAALRSNGTAFYNSVTTGGGNSGILVMLHPLSRGTVNIDPANLNAEPLVDYRALSNPLDATVMMDLIRFNRRVVFNTTTNAQYGPVESQPGQAVQSDADFRTYLTNTLSPTEYHPVGTCAMMPKELGGVVDEKLKVYGVKNLRIVDGSTMPTLPGANTCQTVYAVAEKAADLIKADAK